MTGTDGGQHAARADADADAVERCAGTRRRTALVAAAPSAPAAPRSSVDWTAQAAAVVKGVRLTDDEWTRTRCLIVDASFRVIASSDGQGVLEERFALRTSGFSHAGDGSIVSFAETPGYETYRGPGWYGVIVRRPAVR
ncbi:hypothetical protein [Burkholderia alba]|uniref:hypothetical protein n=1 Tax=Burkholderia alba TaxID=2683677 RepID=UPI002B061EDF|nr:hypothetical protein [Burkholderia alba]